MSNFETELTSLLNRHSVENECDTPDFILADYIRGCLNTFNLAIKNRDSWHGFVPFGRKIGARQAIPVSTPVHYYFDRAKNGYIYEYELDGEERFCFASAPNVAIDGHNQAFLDAAKAKNIPTPNVRDFISGPDR